MTQQERARATALLFVYVHPLVQALAARAVAPDPPLISEREAAALERFCRQHRDQLTARGDGRLVPADPPAAEGGTQP